MLVGWDTLETPTYRHRRSSRTSPAASSRSSLLEQLALLPAVCEKLGFLVAKAPGYEADDFLAAAAQDVARRRCSSRPPIATRTSSSATA